MTRDDLIAAWRFVRAFRPEKPERLCTFWVRVGGLRDPFGDVRALLGGPRGRPGLINNTSGRTLDDAALAAWERRYLRTEDRPTVQELLDAIGDDLTGEGVYSEHDAEQYARWREYALYYQVVDEHQLAGLVSLAQVLRLLDTRDAHVDVPF